MSSAISLVGACLIPVYAVVLLVLAIATFTTLGQALSRVWCSVVHRASHFHGMSCTRCLRCGRLWLSTLHVVPGGGERDGLRRDPGLRVVGGGRG